jgi:hypothetical protein
MKKLIISTIVLAFIVAAATATVGFVAPLRSIGAASTDRHVPPAEVAGLVADMAPGAEVREQPDGSVSVKGVLHAAARAEMARAHQLASQWPAIIQCTAAGGVSTCHPVADSDVKALVAAGAKGLYNRVIYRAAYEPSESGMPLFDADELVCNGQATLTCRRVDVARPTLARSETLFMTYRPSPMSVNADGGLVIRVDPHPTVPLQRTP